MCLLFALKILEVRERFEAAKKALADKQAELNRCSKEIKAFQVAKEKASKASTQASLDVRQLTHKLKQWEKDSKDAVSKKDQLVKSYPWIEREREFFGRPGSDFDFEGKDVRQFMQRHRDLKLEQVLSGDLIITSVLSLLKLCM